MYSTRFHGCPKDSDVNTQTDSTPDGTSPSLITCLQAYQPNNIRCPKEKERKGDNI